MIIVRTRNTIYVLWFLTILDGEVIYKILGNPSYFPKPTVVKLHNPLRIGDMMTVSVLDGENKGQIVTTSTVRDITST